MLGNPSVYGNALKLFFTFFVNFGLKNVQHFGMIKYSEQP